MNPEHLKKLAGASNTEELRRAIEELCRPVGRAKNIHLLQTKHGAEYLCFVELESPKLNLSIIEKLGGFNYGNSVVFRIPNVTVAVRHGHGLANHRCPPNGPPNTNDGEG